MRVNAAHAIRPCTGFTRSGDATIFETRGSKTLFGIIDVLGHGPNAASVADTASAHLGAADLSHSLPSIVDALHKALVHTRGAAAGLCLVNNTAVEMAVVGNIEMRSLGTRIGIIATPGIVGRRIRRLRSYRFEMKPGDRIVVFSDGLSNALDVQSIRALDAEQACAQLIANYAVPQDDASVVVADFCHD